MLSSKGNTRRKSSQSLISSPRETSTNGLGYLSVLLMLSGSMSKSQSLVGTLKVIALQSLVDLSIIPFVKSIFNRSLQQEEPYNTKIKVFNFFNPYELVSQSISLICLPLNKKLISSLFKKQF